MIAQHRTASAGVRTDTRTGPSRRVPCQKNRCKWLGWLDLGSGRRAQMDPIGCPILLRPPQHCNSYLFEGLRPSDSPTSAFAQSASARPRRSSKSVGGRSLARRFAGALRSRGSLALLARIEGFKTLISQPRGFAPRTPRHPPSREALRRDLAEAVAQAGALSRAASPARFRLAKRFGETSPELEERRRARSRSPPSAFYFFLTPNRSSVATTSAPAVRTLTFLSISRIFPSGPM
jgi:hypothetical protein